MEMLADFDTRRWRTLATNLKNSKPSWKKLARAMRMLYSNIFKKLFQSFH